MYKLQNKPQRRRPQFNTQPSGYSHKSDFDQTSYTSREFVPEVLFLGHSLQRFQNNFRKKKTGPFQELARSSLQGPFGGQHVSGLVKPLGQTKHIVREYHNRYQKDPIMQTNIHTPKTRVRVPPTITTETKQLQQRKYYLPSDRKIRTPTVRHHNKETIMLEHDYPQPNPEKVEYGSTTQRLKNVLSYSYAKHQLPIVTPKVTQVHHRK